MDINPSVDSILDSIVEPILDSIFNSFILKFGRREIYDANIYSAIHKEFITALLNQHSVTIGATTPLHDKTNRFIEITELDCSKEYDEIETLALHLSLQLTLLEKRGYTMLYLHPADILKIKVQVKDKDLHTTTTTTTYKAKSNGTSTSTSTSTSTACLYMLVDLTQLVPLSQFDSNKLVLTYPALYPLPKGVCAPELYRINVLPFITHRSASYYSLGLLCLHLLNYQNLSLNHLRDTPLFYFLERCLKEEPLERMCIFI